MGKDDTLFTTQQAASALGVSDSYVGRLIGMGKAAPHSRVGHIYVFTQPRKSNEFVTGQKEKQADHLRKCRPSAQHN